jgi:hypothetical protein
VTQTYPYDGGDLFAVPQSYWFAPAGPDLLKGWKDSRAQAIDRLRTVAAPDARGKSPAEAGHYEAAAARSEAVTADAIFEEIRLLEPSAAWPRLRPFVHKFEVFRRLFTHYEPSSLRRHRLAQPAPLELYVSFAECLAASATNLQALSTLLKLCDALCGTIPVAPWTRAGAERLATVLELERAAVDAWL